MRPATLLVLCLACALFIGASSAAKAWALAPGWPRLVLTLALYTAGNLLMLRLVRDLGMATAFSVSSALQLVAVNLVAILAFGERVGVAEGSGIVLALAGIVLMTLGPRLGF